MQPYGVNPWYFKLKLFFSTELIVWNINKVYDSGLQRWGEKSEFANLQSLLIYRVCKSAEFANLQSLLNIKLLICSHRSRPPWKFASIFNTKSTLKCRTTFSWKFYNFKATEFNWNIFEVIGEKTLRFLCVKLQLLNHCAVFHVSIGHIVFRKLPLIIILIKRENHKNV